MSETKFPEKKLHEHVGYRGGEPINPDSEDFANHYYDAYETDEWLKRCLEDYPNVKAIVEAPQDIGINRTFQALLCVNEWKVKWFGGPQVE